MDIQQSKNELALILFRLTHFCCQTQDTFCQLYFIIILSYFITITNYYFLYFNPIISFSNFILRSNFGSKKNKNPWFFKDFIGITGALREEVEQLLGQKI